ncbi:MAG: signal peptide peptidase SppA [Pirellulales bacterium]|nr:signal peptide peptidase SppA [Pirellulales bacterium]
MDEQSRPEERPSQSYENYVSAEVVRQPPPAWQPPRRRSGLLSFFLVAVVLLLGASVLLNLMLLVGTGFETTDQVREKTYEPDRFGRGAEKVAIISVEGVILDGEGFVTRQIEQARKDDDVKAVVLRVESPGGTISGSDFIYHRLKEFRNETGKPIVVSMGSIAASGGYYVSMAVGETPESIFAEPTTWTGSIGVIIPHYNFSSLMKELGVEEDSIASHRLKGMGSFAKPMTEEERGIFQDLVNEGFDRFKTVVKFGRPGFSGHPEKLDEVATGQVFTAEQAQKHGLIDKIAFLDDAIKRAMELGGVDPNNYRVVKYQPEPTLASVLFGDEIRSRGPDLSALLDLASPRAYYLYTWLPAAVTSRR